MATSKRNPRKKKTATRRQRADEVRTRILDAALQLFAVHGFEGTVLQEIAEQSGAGLSLVIYHFKSKKNLWREAVDAAAQRFYSRISAMESASDLSATQKLRQLLPSLVRLCAEFPEFNRIVAMEGYQKSDRLTWLANRFARRSFETIFAIITEAQKEGGIRPNLRPDRLRYAIVGVASIPSVAAEFRQLTGRDPTSTEEVEASIDFIDKLVFVEQP